MSKYNFGDSVSIRATSSVDVVGRVTFIGVNGRNESYYHVVDEFGQYWHRTADEMVPANDNLTATPTQATA